MCTATMSHGTLLSAQGRVASPAQLGSLENLTKAYLVLCLPPSPDVPPRPGFPASPQTLIFLILKQTELCLF